MINTMQSNIETRFPAIPAYFQKLLTTKILFLTYKDLANSLTFKYKITPEGLAPLKSTEQILFVKILMSCT